MPLLKTERLTLGPCTSEDRDDFIQLELDREVMRFLNNGAVDLDRIDPAHAPFLMPRGASPTSGQRDATRMTSSLAGSACRRMLTRSQKSDIVCARRFGVMDWHRKGLRHWSAGGSRSPGMTRSWRLQWLSTKDRAV